MVAFAALVLIDEPAYGGLVKIPTAQGLSVEEHLACIVFQVGAKPAPYGYPEAMFPTGDDLGWDYAAQRPLQDIFGSEPADFEMRWNARRNSRRCCSRKGQLVSRECVILMRSVFTKRSPGR
jgi:hypothetical protein